MHEDVPGLDQHHGAPLSQRHVLVYLLYSSLVSSINPYLSSYIWDSQYQHGFRATPPFNPKSTSIFE